MTLTCFFYISGKNTPMLSRRLFIRNSSLLATALCIKPFSMLANPSSGKVGLQLYTVRDNLSRDFDATLKKIAAIGYNHLEAAGYQDGKFYDQTPSELKKKVSDLGMTLNSSHAMFATEGAERAIEAHKELGVDYLVFPSLPESNREDPDSYLRAAGKMNEIGEQCREYSIQFGYHNHQYEYNDLGGVNGYDLLLKNTGKENVFFEIDLCWTVAAGYDPLYYFRKHPGRFKLWHVKDITARTDGKLTEVGTGIIDFQEIFDAKEVAGMEHFYIEQDTCEMDPLESVAISYNNVLKLKY